MNLDGHLVTSCCGIDDGAIFFPIYGRFEGSENDVHEQETGGKVEQESLVMVIVIESA